MFANTPSTDALLLGLHMGNHHSSQRLQLLDAAAVGDLRTLEGLIQRTDVNTQDEVHDSASDHPPQSSKTARISQDEVFIVVWQSLTLLSGVMQDGWCALHAAAYKGQIDALQLLLRSHASVHVQDHVR